MPTLRPFRDYDEKDVINLYAISGATLPVNKGTLVYITRGFRADDVNPLEMLGSYGDFSPSNTVAQRYGVVPKIGIAGTGNNPLGITLFDVRETDENGEMLKYRPRKASEMEAILSGQAVPVVTRGIFLYSGIVGTITAGQDLYAGPNGTITGTNPNSAGYKVGKALGATGADGSCLVWLDCR
jgi:hypothetical protein